MSCPQCGCAIPEVVNIPGTTGAAGAAGVAGQPAFTLLTANATFPNTATPVAVSVASSIWMAVGQIVLLSDGTNIATCVVTAVSALTPNLVTLQWNNYAGDSAGPVTVNSGGRVVCAGAVNLANPLTVPNGGTGAATLTGILFGNGAAAMTGTNITGIVLAAGASAPTGLTYQTGTVTLVAGAKTINTVITITANSIVIFTLATKGAGALTGAPYLTATPTVGGPGTGTIVIGTGGATDTSTYNFIILN